MLNSESSYDLLVVGAGINGAGIARDAAGRGLRVLIVEKGDLASATSQWSTKLIHGGLRYLEQFEFRLVRDALAEREVVLHQAPHIVAPLMFVLPHEPHLRPAWMLRAGLFLYDHLGRRETLPGSFGVVDLASTPWGAGLKPNFHKGFVYSDARVDDARLVVFNVMDARDRGAEVRVRTRLVAAQREQTARGPSWRATLATPSGSREIEAKVIVNATGPWVKAVRESINGFPSAENIRHVKGSHIVVPRVQEGDHAYILQNADKRIVFVIPYEDQYSLIGTTDVAVDSYEAPQIDSTEIDYLLELANTYLARPLRREDIVWSYSGVRPLYDDGSTDPSAITRDYVFEVDTGAQGAPLLSIYGGKITTYRKLAEQALDQIARFLPPLKPRWTAYPVLPGGDLPSGGLPEWIAELTQRYPDMPASLLRGLARRHGSRAADILDGAHVSADLGIDFGQGLSEAEVRHVVRTEWACTGADVLWRRTKCGIGMTAAQRAHVDAFVAGCVPIEATVA